MYESREIFPPASIAPYSHGSSVQPLSDGGVIAVWYAGAYEKARDVGIYLSRLTARSKSWEPPVLIEREGTSELSGEPSSEGNPVIYYDSEHKRLWLWWVTMLQADSGWSNCVIKTKHSDDLGKTWTRPRILRDMIGWMTRHKPIKMSNGEILLPCYSEFGGLCGIFYICTAFEFAKGAVTSQWIEPSVFVTGNVSQPTVVEWDPAHKPGHLLAFMRADKGGKYSPYLAMTRSEDFGRTWSQAEITPAKLHNPDSGADMARLPNGHLVLAFNPEPKGRTTLRVALSEDHGISWPFWKDLEHDPTQSFAYPAINLARDGTLHLIWSHRGNTIKWAHFTEDYLKQ